MQRCIRLVYHVKTAYRTDDQRCRKRSIRSECCFCCFKMESKPETDRYRKSGTDPVCYGQRYHECRRCKSCSNAVQQRQTGRRFKRTELDTDRTGCNLSENSCRCKMEQRIHDRCTAWIPEWKRWFWPVWQQINRCRYDCYDPAGTGTICKRSESTDGGWQSTCLSERCYGRRIRLYFFRICCTGYPGTCLPETGCRGCRFCSRIKKYLLNAWEKLLRERRRLCTSEKWCCQCNGFLPDHGSIRSIQKI